MPLFNDAARQLDLLHQAKHNWSCPSINLPVATSLVDATEVEINLTRTIGHKTRVNWRAVDSDSDVHWLPPRFNQSGENKVFLRDVLVPHFTSPAARPVSISQTMAGRSANSALCFGVKKAGLVNTIPIPKHLKISQGRTGQPPKSQIRISNQNFQSQKRRSVHLILGSIGARAFSAGSCQNNKEGRPTTVATSG